MYLIEKIWIDSLENSYERAVGYNVIGYVETLEEAESIVKNGSTYTKSNCWAISKEMPQYRYKTIPKLEAENGSLNNEHFYYNDNGQKIWKMNNHNFNLSGGKK